MPSWLSLLVRAIIVAVVVGLVLLLIGMLLVSLGVPILKTLGSFLGQWCWVIGALSGLWYFFTGGSWSLGSRA